MKNLILTAICIFTYICSFAFSGGTGTANNPYLIANFSDWYNMIGQGVSNLVVPSTQTHYRLISDITIEPYNIPSANDYFNGVLHGGGHILYLPSTTNILDEEFMAFFLMGGITGRIDSIKIIGNTNYKFSIAEAVMQGGEINACTNEVNISLPRENCYPAYFFFADQNIGIIRNCINYGNINILETTGDAWDFSFAGGIVCWNEGGEINGCKNYGNIIGCFASGGICAVNNGIVRNCTNYGDVISPQDLILDEVTEHPSGGIYAITDGVVVSTCENCINYGHINAGKIYSGGGIVGGGAVSYSAETIENITRCANYGEVIGGKYIGGICGKANNVNYISSCFNAGQVASATSSGGIVGTVYDSARISNCLDVSGMHIMIDKWEVTGDSISNMSSNYYDRQMSGGSGEDIYGETEGRFTSQLTGDTPELRAMLGDGWSYAEGRYPIPLGLENDSLAMLFATPIYLREISDYNYDHTNLVRNNFTVGTENGVSWSSGNRLSIDGENATILASGSEVATASLAGYSFTRRLNLINPVSIEEQGFDVVKVFPNPATDILNITSSETISEIEIVNVMGQVVKRMEVNADNAVCDVEDLNAGVYIVRIYGTDADSILDQRKVVKN